MRVLKPVTWVTRHLIELGTGICLPTSAKIGPGFAINHHGPIIVHGDFQAGENFTLSHQTTVGALHDGVPTAGDCVFIGPGARVLGAIQLGDRAMIGANAVVTSDVPADHVAVGVPARARPDSGEPWLRGRAPGVTTSLAIARVGRRNSLAGSGSRASLREIAVGQRTAAM